jgi:(1->4)-alpha-D-glucan 1-alpha-D-glucosylmutase
VTTLARQAGEFGGEVAGDPKRIPSATYRLQFNRGFTFRQAREVLAYLRELGISDVYASPLFQAGPESTHGYDTCCFKINSNLGSLEDFERFTDELKERGLGLLLDLVPNHMSATLSNPWWLDVLENGRQSRYARFFDINWDSENPALCDKVLLPVLEDHYAKVLKAGKLRLVRENGIFFIAYYDRKFPVNRPSLADCGINKPEAILRDQLDALIQRQHYRLAGWRDAAEEINYRRFFDVTEMVALKMELPELFRETHQLVFEWIASGRITGLRIDHPDGLWDPKQYLERLQKERPLYVVVEKILCGDEQLPRDWLADGTTGYDFLNRVNGLFVDGRQAAAFDGIYRDFTGSDVSVADIVYRSRKQVLERSFASELNSLAHRLKELAANAREGRDLNLTQLRTALEEVIASFPVYRTYITESSQVVSKQDRDVIQKGFKVARERAGTRVESIAFDFIERLLLLEDLGALHEAGAGKIREFVMKFQQLTGPAMAKGLEDTAFYRFNRLVSLNEVGGEPGKFGMELAEFHEVNATMAKNWPHTLLASATHDTKRGEDVRARLNVLSEVPTEWRDAVTRWARMNHGNKTASDGGAAPSANDEYLFYQTIVGAWPGNLNDQQTLNAFRERVAAFMLKAVKEAKVNTSWTETNAAYENALRQFVDRTLVGSDNRFLGDFERFAGRVAFFGRFNSLAQTLLKITSPGVPDFYQGAELWDLNLVDPDNRRAVDYETREKLLAEVKSGFEGVADAAGNFLSALLRDEKPGAVKLFLIWHALNFRATRREMFDSGEYLPLSAAGDCQQHVCAFARTRKEQRIVAIVPRLVFALTGGTEVSPIGEIWKNTMLPVPAARKGDLYRNVLTREMVPVVEKDGTAALELREALKSFPVALLEKI